MNIVSSEAIYDDHTQPSGLVYVYEKYTDQYGNIYQSCVYLIEPNFDMAARLTERSAALSEQLADNEAQGILNGANT